MRPEPAPLIALAIGVITGCISTLSLVALYVWVAL